jgi:hypothetical protein
MSSHPPEGVNIGTISGGIVNFGGAVNIAPISVTKTVAGSGGSSTAAGNTSNSSTTNPQTLTDLVNLIRTML